MEEKKVILAVDDMSENLTVLKTMLKDYFDVRLAKSAKMALSLLKNNPVDLILLDIEMPEISGFQFLQLLAETLPDRTDIPVIFLTSHTAPDLINQAMNTGAKDYLVKPIIAETLLKKINTFIR